MMEILIRADASPKIGTGHVMRCIALAQAWIEEGGRATFLMIPGMAALEARLRAEGIRVIHMPFLPGTQQDVQQTVVHANSWDVTWVVVDGYQFGTDYQRAIKNTGLNLLLIDDYGHAEQYWADLVLNQNVYAHETIYANRDACTQLLLGTSYALLRKEFWPWRNWSRQFPAVARKILVTLGGADPNNVTLNVIQALLEVEVDGLEVMVVVGSANPHYEELYKFIQESEIAITLKQNVDNMPELMAWADLAITAGGSTCWEIAFMGLPSLVIVLAENQCAIAEKLDVMNAAINMGWHTKISPNTFQLEISKLARNIDLRRKLSQNDQQLIDGEGSDRLIMHLQNEKLRLGVVRKEHCELIWRWANDPTTRTHSFSSKSIPWGEHIQWFNAKQQSPNFKSYIALDIHDVPLGIIRFDMGHDEAIVSITIGNPFRGRGYGRQLIDLACSKLLRISNIVRIHAYIQPDNQASLRAFLSAGFEKFETTTYTDIQAIHLIRQR